MPYMVQLTSAQALKFAGVGVPCLGLAYGLFKTAEALDALGKRAIERLENSANQPGNAASIISLRSRIKILETIQRVVLAILLLAMFLLWAAGTALVMYAAVGPLL